MAEMMSPDAALLAAVTVAGPMRDGETERQYQARVTDAALTVVSLRSALIRDTTDTGKTTRFMKILGSKTYKTTLTATEVLKLPFSDGKTGVKLKLVFTPGPKHDDSAATPFFRTIGPDGMVTTTSPDWEQKATWLRGLVGHDLLVTTHTVGVPGDLKGKDLLAAVDLGPAER